MRARGPGRPREYGKRTTLGVRISPEVRRALRIEAAEQGRTIGVVVNRALIQYLKRHGWEGLE
jgi:hypothetical protein